MQDLSVVKNGRLCLYLGLQAFGSVYPSAASGKDQLSEAININDYTKSTDSSF